MSDLTELDQFFSTSNKELLSTVNRLDKLIGNNHWLSVGTYKETLIKKSLRQVIPNKYSIDSGFVIAADKDGKIIRSTQTDILIWDSVNYSPLFRDTDFVIIPPEACKIMIEVKGVLSSSELKKSLENFDSMIDFCFVPLLQHYNIKKYIFAYDLKRMKFPNGIFNVITSAYENNTKISLNDRMDCMKKWGWPTDNKPWPLLAIDGIFILSDGLILRRDRAFTEGVRFLFNSFSVRSKNESQVYSIFETEILSSLGNYSNGKQGLWYVDQAGLLSLRTQIKIKPSEPKSLMIFPRIKVEEMYKDIDQNIVF
jgi:hypothetical protein